MIKLKDTRISMAGVFRCCLSSVGHEFYSDNSELEEGSESNCKHCGRNFHLVKIKDKLMWIPKEN